MFVIINVCILNKKHVCAEPLADIRCSVDFIINLLPSCIGEWLGCLAVENRHTLHN